VSRGPITLERLRIDGDGLVVYELKHPFRDGTTHVLFEPFPLHRISEAELKRLRKVK